MRRQEEFDRIQETIQKAKELNGESCEKTTGGKIAGAIGSISSVGQLGISMFVCILLGFLLGLWLDGIAGTGRWLLLLCTIFGAASAFKLLFDYAKKG